MTDQGPGSAVERAIAALRAGELIVVVDGAEREDEADLVGAAELMTEERMAFMVHHTTGLVCIPMQAERCAELHLPQMVETNTDAHGTAFTVSVDHVASGTGVSASARTRTVRALADPNTRPDHLRRPGHVFPLRACEGGTTSRPGHTEATTDLMRLAGLSPVGVISEIVAPDGSMLRGRDAAAFAARHDLPLLTIAELIEYLRRSAASAAVDDSDGAHATRPEEPVGHRPQATLVERVATATMPTSFGDFTAIAFRAHAAETDHLALVKGDLAAANATSSGVLTRVHSECLTGDILGSLRCDCGNQLAQAASLIAEEGCGVIVYLRGHEGRGIGLTHKIQAYALQEDGRDTVEANVDQGLPVDLRSYEVGSRILAELGVSRIRLITGNPTKAEGLRGNGLTVAERISLPSRATAHNVRYLRTKRDRMGHSLDIQWG